MDYGRRVQAAVEARSGGDEEEVPLALGMEIGALRPGRVVALGSLAMASLEELNAAFEHFYHPLYVARFRRSLMPEPERLVGRLVLGRG